MATGEIIGSFCLTEPDAGSDAASVRLTAKKDGDDYLLNGTKRYITNAPKAQLLTVFARTNANEAGSRGVSAFLVDVKSTGISMGQPYRKMGQQGTYVCDVMFDDVRVSAANLVGGKEDVGFRTAMKVLDKGRLHISALSVGIAERLIRDSVIYASERKQFGKPIFEFQMIQSMLARSQTEMYAARCMVEDAARRRDAGENVAALGRRASYSPPKWLVASPTTRCKYMVAPVMLKTMASNGFTATCGCSASMKGLPKFSKR